MGRAGKESNLSMSHNKIGDERRGKIRVDFETQIIIETGSGKYHEIGSSRDLSLSGIYVNTKEKITLDTQCKVKVVLLGTIEPVTLQMNGRVVRSESPGTAIVFDSMDIDTYTHLKNIIKYNTNRPDDVF